MDHADPTIAAQCFQDDTLWFVEFSITQLTAWLVSQAEEIVGTYIEFFSDDFQMCR